MKSLWLLLTTVATAQAVFSNVFQREWKDFMLKHGKTYDTESEEMFRKIVYAVNKIHIDKHNLQFQKGNVTFSQKLNQFGDMHPMDFARNINGFNRASRHSKSNSVRGAVFIPPAALKTLPDQVDWTKKGAVTEVKDQGHCGSYWAFSATGALEGQHFRHSGDLISLSEQNLIDCSFAYGNNGCDGGAMENAFQYVSDNKGIDTEMSYPYEGHEGICRYDPHNSGADDVGYVTLPVGDEEMLKHAVASVGPVSAAIDASHHSFRFYSKGIYYKPQCSSVNLDHGVLVVGYGTDEAGGDYWLVKNSWARTWGDLGYIKMARNKDNHCGIASAASYPLVK